MSDRKVFLIFISVFAVLWFLPVESIRFQSAIIEAFALTHWYAREHVILCLIPAFFIAGAIAVFVSQNSVMKYLGAGANRIIAYSVAASSGTILAVCSCTVLPLFAGIYARGAGIGPASAFLYSGPAINVLAIILTARVLGAEIGIARAIGAIVFSVVIGVLMQFIFRKEEAEKALQMPEMPEEIGQRKLWQDAIYFALMVLLLIFLNWAKPDGDSSSFYGLIFGAKWYISGFLLVTLFAISWRWFTKNELKEWTSSAWEYARMVMPLLFVGVMIAGFLLGRPGNEGIIPNTYVEWLLGGNSVWTNLFASIVGAFMYFATLTEVPILEGLIGAGMGKGPALALLLAGPALSLPNMLVIRGVIGTKKTAVYVVLVVIMATISGIIFGSIVE